MKTPVGIYSKGLPKIDRAMSKKEEYPVEKVGLPFGFGEDALKEENINFKEYRRIVSLFKVTFPARLYMWWDDTNPSENKAHIHIKRTFPELKKAIEKEVGNIHGDMLCRSIIHSAKAVFPAIQKDKKPEFKTLVLYFENEENGNRTRYEKNSVVCY